jgi:cellulose synthase/poly-beta-1,6-N-acetylglucosamine synthase-like glycosyltransferase
MNTVAYVFVALPVAIFGWAYVGYPTVLWIASRFRPARPAPSDPETWPLISITVPAFNEAARIGSTIESLLAIDYPTDRRQIVIVSDASTDDTDRIVSEYADRGVELFRVKNRGGKTAAENEAIVALRGDIIVNTDASIRIQPQSVKALVRALQDPTVGVASGRDISIGAESEGNRGESGYVGYEMWVRELETRIGGIVGASGCCYAARAQVQRTVLQNDLARDFASALIARRLGLRAVSVSEATAIVPRTPSLRSEMSRKARTMTQGLQTLAYGASLMNPFRHGTFAFALASHKLARWLVYPCSPLAVIGIAWLALTSRIALALLVAMVLGILAGVAAMRWPEGRRVPMPLAFAGYALASTLGGLNAWILVARGRRLPMWEPTRRAAIPDEQR